MKPKNFPNTTEIQRINTLGEFEKLADNNQEPVLPLNDIITKQFKTNTALYISHALPAKITEFYSDLVHGDPERLQITTANEGVQDRIDEITQDNDVIERIGDWADDQSTFGYFVLYGYEDADQKYRIAQAYQDQYFPQPDGSVVFATYEKDQRQTDKDLNDRDTVCYIQRYTLTNSGVEIKRGVYETIDGQKLKDNRLPDEQYLTPYFGTEAQENLAGLTELPIAQCDNTKPTRAGFGRSDYAPILPQLGEINESRTQVKVDLLKNTNAILERARAETSVGDDGVQEQLDTIVLGDNQTPRAKYVTNDNPLLRNNEEHIKSQIEMLSVVTGVPLYELTGGNMPERVESLRIKLFSAIRKTNRKRAKIQSALKKMYRVGLAMKGQSVESFDFAVKFSDVLPVDELVTAQTEQTKLDSGMTSRVSAIRRVQGVSQEEAEAELEIIRTEERQDGRDVINSDNPPTL